MSKKMEMNLISVDPIPIELVLEILLRLPVKSLARFVCVSKLWQNTIRSDEFIRSYSLRSSPKKLPRLLCALEIIITDRKDLYFFTKPAPVLTPTVTKERYIYLRKPRPLAVKEPSRFVSSSSVCHSNGWCSQNPNYAHGMISYLHGNDQIICNPTVDKYITLPVPPCNDKDTVFSSFLGYDPSNGQYKVLAFSKRSSICYHQVLTLGAQNCSWRMIQCSSLHYPVTRHVCIEGFLYYGATAPINTKFLVRFDLSSESLEVVSVITKGFDSWNQTSYLSSNSLINYHGKVAAVYRNNDHFNLWVLEDAKEQKWSNERLTLPESSIVWSIHRDLEILGTSDMGEIVFTHIRYKDVYFLDQKSNRIRIVKLDGNTNHNFTFLHYIDVECYVCLKDSGFRFCLCSRLFSTIVRDLVEDL